MWLPEFLQSYQEAAKELLTQGLIKDIEFSGPTYQVQVVDSLSGQAVWAFLQLDPRGQIKDCFCSCEGAEDVSSCVHIAAAFLYIYQDHPEPLHIRFSRSLWNSLCMVCARNWGYDPTILEHQKRGEYAYTPHKGETLFRIKGKTELKELLHQRPHETEETSLKFSNLSEEEIENWREGHPSFELSYELSFWTDIAKWLMLLQDDKQPYTISFGYTPKRIPDTIHIIFPVVEISCHIRESDLPSLIPSLATVLSPLKVHDIQEEALEHATYDKETQTLHIASKRQISEQSLQEKGVMLDGWWFVPEDGFYISGPHPLIETPILRGQQLDRALDEHAEAIAPILSDAVLHPKTLQAHYELVFDEIWNLQIACYVKKPGDLQRPLSTSFGHWVYVENDGFYQLEGMYFDDIVTIIPVEEVATFVQVHRMWLNTQEGFETHVANLETQLTYNVNEEGYLTFSREVVIKEEAAQAKDFGRWVYLAGQGFYSKLTPHVGLPLQPGIALSPDQVPLFIRSNRNELQLVPKFFSEKCPLRKAGLYIELTEAGTIVCSPQYDFLPEYQEESVRFYDDFVFVEGEGFCELPGLFKLPEKYRHPVMIDAKTVPHFLHQELQDLKKHINWIDPRLMPPSYVNLCAEKITTKEKGLYQLKFSYKTRRGSITASSLWTAFQQRKRFLFSQAGCLDLSEKRYKWLLQLKKKQIDRRSNTIKLTTMELIRLNVFEEITLMHKEDEEVLSELTEFRVPEKPDITGLKSTLRPYQELGVHWLWFLYQHQLSGLLCDDMGLGKTHQGMALLAAVINKHKQHHEPTTRHFLIVCPTSVIYHWQEKLEEFLPGVRVCTFHGSKRSLGEFQKDYDILLTSYGIWRNECPLLSKIPFEVAIFDEVQIAKTHTSRIHQSLLKVKATMRLGLTGTPIENYLRELKALFDLVLPSYMPTDAEYRELFIKPIEQQNNPERRRKLSRFIKPFILRRKKGDVLSDLPPKTEEIAHCELLPQQKALYLDVLERRRQQILIDLENSDQQVPYIHIFALLTSLKQICNHPAVFLKTPERYKEYDSGKWDLFVELLEEARESKQKVVVFSQYLNMLDIIESYLLESGIGFSTVRGATINRAEQIRRFNRDPNCEVFVGSLRAVGLGIDLTAGSVVIHYDRWWNAAREDQATDRVHRIGQTRGVQVFKLVTKGTFEEKIDLLIARKGRLMEEVVGVDDHQIIKQFSRDEIIQLLQYVEPIQ